MASALAHWPLCRQGFSSGDGKGPICVQAALIFCETTDKSPWLELISGSASIDNRRFASADR